LLLDHALIQQATLYEKMREPDDFDLHWIQSFLISNEGVANKLIGNDEGVWGSRTAAKRTVTIL
jgi:hypothetical protein